MNRQAFRLMLALVLLASAATVRGEERVFGFDTAADTAGWVLQNGAAMEFGHGRADGGGALRVPPRATAELRLRDHDGSGTVNVWVFDDGAAPSDPKQRRAGPRWGLASEAGRVLTAGCIYAPYLDGAGSYALGEYTPAKKEQPYFQVAYLGVARQAGWHRWTFDFDADKGLHVSCDDRDVNAATLRFDWNRSQVPGFVGVVLYGDEPGEGAQTIWVDDVAATLGGPMQVVPAPPPPPPPVVPAADPPLDGPPARLLDAVRDTHPRLLFGPGDVERLRAFYQSEAGVAFRQGLLDYLPCCTAPAAPAFLEDATDAQRQGYWRIPTVALHYVLTGDRASFDRTVGFMRFLLAQEHWETGDEQDSGMSAANIMAGAALAYDWLYNELDPALREQFRQKLLYHARAMYHGGHLAKNGGVHYWQSDPANNHRWHRNAGLVLAALAVANDSPDERWILARLRPEMDYVSAWLPADGTCHEGSTYAIFGGSHLTLAAQAMDRCFGTSYLQQPYFRNAPAFFMHTLQPGLQTFLPFGDGGGVGSYAAFLYKGAAVHGDANMQAALDAVRARLPVPFQEFVWFALLWYDPGLKGGSLSALPMAAFFDDLGLATLRDGWDTGDVALLFKCGPFGGYRLNAFRNATQPPTYINVAHDNPDANSFVLCARGTLLAETCRYSNNKTSANHNTILINGIGQTVDGRDPGGPWSQPGSGDMTRMAVVTAWTNAGDFCAIEGEAAGAYPARAGQRPALERFRRLLIWVKGAYVLVLDDVRAPEPVDIDWLMQGPTLAATEAASGRFRLAQDAAVCSFQLVSDAAFEHTIAPSPADNAGTPLGWQQLRVRTHGAAVRYASVYDPWQRGYVSVAMETNGPDSAAVTVRGPGFADTWTWRAGPAPFGASAFAVRRASGGAGGVVP
ncbi:MAG: DUF4962 domain-containing protein [Lentisphaerae bacterium]|nr:DUF4962 domain-containing protein [Lentisphaerota bacterium]